MSAGSVVLWIILTRKLPSSCPWALLLLQHLDKEIPFKVSVGSVVLLQHLHKKLPFNVSVGSVVLLQHHPDKEIPFKVSVGSVVLLQNLDKEIPFKVSVLTRKFPLRCPWALRFGCKILM